ncbi:hypothetical protein ACYSNW_00805 [Enterococcus sp. LJL99]
MIERIEEVKFAFIGILIMIASMLLRSFFSINWHFLDLIALIFMGIKLLNYLYHLL